MVIFSKLLRSDENFSKPLKISIAAAVMTLFLYHGFELWLISTGSVVAALGDYFTVEISDKNFRIRERRGLCVYKFVHNL